MIFFLRNNSHTLERQELMRPSTSTSKAKKTEMPTSGWLDSDDDDYNDDKQPLLSEKVLKQQQQYLLKGRVKNIKIVFIRLWIVIYIVYLYCIEQDDGLNELASIVSRQKNIAITISSEVDLQNGQFKMQFVMVGYNNYIIIL